MVGSAHLRVVGLLGICYSNHLIQQPPLPSCPDLVVVTCAMIGLYVFRVQAEVHTII